MVNYLFMRNKYSFEIVLSERKDRCGIINESWFRRVCLLIKVIKTLENAEIKQLGKVEFNLTYFKLSSLIRLDNVFSLYYFILVS